MYLYKFLRFSATSRFSIVTKPSSPDFVGVVANPNLLSISFEVFLLDRVGVDFDVVFEQNAKCFEYSSLHRRVVFFFEYIGQVVQSHNQTDWLGDVSAQIGRQLVIFKIVGDEYAVTAGINHFDSGEEVFVVYVPACQKVQGSIP